MTRRIFEDYGDDIAARAAGGEVSARLMELIVWLKTISLDESCGEGWHRGSNYEKKRAYASTPASLKRAVRRKNVFLRLKRFRRKYGHRADAVLRFEFRNWKRILSKRRRKWTAPRMRDEEAFDAIYREGKACEVNWSAVVSRMDLDRVETDTPSAAEAAQNEYLRSVAEPGTCYGFPQEQPQPASSRAIVPAGAPPPVHFRLIGLAHARS